jgi:hypothetical protein
MRVYKLHRQVDCIFVACVRLTFAEAARLPLNVPALHGLPVHRQM